MDQNVSKKETIDVSGEEQGRSLPQWFGQMFLGRKKNRSDQGSERHLSVDISDLDSSSDSLPYDGRHHPEFELPSVRLVDEDGSSENIERTTTSQSEAKKKQQKLLEEFALLSGIELSSQSVSDLRDSVEKQLEIKPLSPFEDQNLEGTPSCDYDIESSEVAELEKQSTGRVHDAYTLLVENQKIVQMNYAEDVELVKYQENDTSSVIESDEPKADLNVASEVVSDEITEYEVKSDVMAENGGSLSKGLAGKSEYDQEAVDSVLSELNKINSIHSIVVVGADGSVLACNNSDQLNESIFGALIFKSVKHYKRLGQQSGLGSLAQSVIEFAEGKLIVENLGDSALFIVVDRSAILGLIRNQTKSQIERLKSILNGIS